MYTHVEYVEVVRYHFIQISKSKRISQLLTVKIPRTKTEFSVSIAARIKVPELRKGDKVKLFFDCYVTGRSDRPRFCVRDIALIY